MRAGTNKSLIIEPHSAATLGWPDIHILPQVNQHVPLEVAYFPRKFPTIHPPLPYGGIS